MKTLIRLLPVWMKFLIMLQTSIFFTLLKMTILATLQLELYQLELILEMVTISRMVQILLMIGSALSKEKINLIFKTLRKVTLSQLTIKLQVNSILEESLIWQCSLPEPLALKSLLRTKSVLGENWIWSRWEEYNLTPLTHIANMW